jgi:hypothetical protein
MHMKSGCKTSGETTVGMEDLTITSGVDAFMKAGKQRKTLAVSRQKRAAFFAEKPLTNEFLRRYQSNPPIEEGAFESKDARSREGELILHVQAVILLIDRLIRPRFISQVSNTDNLHVLGENIDLLKNTIANWHHGGGIDSKIIYLNCEHMIHIYLRKDGGNVMCFIMDSEPGRPVKNIIDVIRAIAPEADITRNTAVLQMDFYSCPIFATRTMKYFVKHGHHLPDYLRSHDRKWNHELACWELQPQDLMPELLKMIQNRINLPNTVLDQIVSHKKQLTLRQYLEKFRYQYDGKDYNASAILKRYKYMEILDTALREQTQYAPK